MASDCQIMVCSTLRELPWLNLCLRSIKKYWQGHEIPIVVITPDCKNSLPAIVSELRSYVIVKPHELHNYIRLTADSYMVAKSILYLDTRELFNVPCDLSSFYDHSCKPIVYTECYHPHMERPCYDDNSIQNQRWVIEEVLGSLPEFEFTYRSPPIFHRNSIRRMREQIEDKTKRHLLFNMRLHTPSYFSPFNFLGHHCYTTENILYAWADRERAGKPFLSSFWGIRDPAKGEDFRAVQSILNPN